MDSVQLVLWPAPVMTTDPGNSTLALLSPAAVWEPLLSLSVPHRFYRSVPLCGSWPLLLLLALAQLRPCHSRLVWITFPSCFDWSAFSTVSTITSL